MTEEHRYTKITVSLLNDHFVFYPRYRRKLFLDESVGGRFKELIQEIGEKYIFKIVTIEADKNYYYLFLNTLSIYSPVDMMNKIKGGTTTILRDEFTHLHLMPSL